MIRKILWGLLAVLVIIQFIRPSRNSGNAKGENDIAHAVNVPEQVMTILEKSCYDCHSNHSEYPWYTNIQPVGWWIQHHIDEGREELNFSEFKTYKLRRQLHKLHECEEQVKEGEMPLGTYTGMHSEAKLSDADQKILVDWVKSAMHELGGGEERERD